MSVQCATRTPLGWLLVPPTWLVRQLSRWLPEPAACPPQGGPPSIDHQPMAQKMLTTLTDDLDPDHEATSTVALSLDGAFYEIDLTDEHADQLRQAVLPYIAAGRRAGTSGSAATTSRTPRGPARDSCGPDAGAVRSWAQQHDIPVSPRGRVKGTVIAQFLEATTS